MLVDKACSVVQWSVVVSWVYLFTGWMLEGWKQVSWSCMLLLNLFRSSSSNLRRKAQNQRHHVTWIFEKWRKHKKKVTIMCNKEGESRDSKCTLKVVCFVFLANLTSMILKTLNGYLKKIKIKVTLCYNHSHLRQVKKMTPPHHIKTW